MEIKKRSILDLQDKFLFDQVKSCISGYKKRHASVRDKSQHRFKIRLLLCEVWQFFGGYLSFASSAHSLKSPLKIKNEFEYFCNSYFSFKIIWEKSPLFREREL